MVIGIDHGYYAIKTKQVCFPTGIIRYEYEPYTMQNVLQYQGEYYVCGTGRQTLVKDKTANDNYYLLTLAALAQEIRKRKGERTAKVVLAAGLPLTGFGREKQKFKEYLFQKQLIRFLYAALAELDEQMERLMVIHQMLGTRISDTLTLQTDCLYRQDGHPMIQIRQMKTTTFVKPISAELELLIEKAIQYTRKMYGDTVYIFVDEKNSKRPMQYNTVQNKVMDLIQKKDLRDDHGELFGFGTHMFRHVYGIRLTELHLDDWTIAKLLGHTSVKNVKFYRKMSLQIIADETREIRAEMSRMIRANLAGWGKEYEQI